MSTPWVHEESVMLKAAPFLDFLHTLKAHTREVMGSIPIGSITKKEYARTVYSFFDAQKTQENQGIQRLWK